MADFARVDSIEVLSEFRASLWKFAEVAQVALGDAESDLTRTLRWLETEQTVYWAGQIRKRQEIVSQATEKLREKRTFKDATGRLPSAVDEERAFRLAKARLEAAEEKLAAVKKNIRVMQKAIHDYKGSVQGLSSAVAHDLPLAVARLDKLSGLLRQYVDLSAPGSATEEAASSAGESMGRLSDTPDAAVVAPAMEEDLPDFPIFESPQVVLVHTHLPTGLILSTDGKTPAEEGNQYRRFANIQEAVAYAQVKVETDPLIECAIFSHARARLQIVGRGAKPDTIQG